MLLLSQLAYIRSSAAGTDSFNCYETFHANHDSIVGREFYVHMSFPISVDNYEHIVESSVDYSLFYAAMADYWNDRYITFEEAYTTSQIEQLRELVVDGLSVPYDLGRRDLEYHKHIPHDYSKFELVRAAKKSFETFDAKMSVVEGWGQLSRRATHACYVAILGGIDD